MTNVKSKVVLIGALAIGLLSLLLVSGRFEGQAASPPKPVLVAAADLKAGARLTLKDLKTVELPSDSVPKSAFLDARALDGRLLVRDVAADAVFADEMLAPLGKASGLATVIAPGSRAMTVRVNDVVGVAGFALPGNYVDIIVNAEERNRYDDSRKAISKIVLEKVLVLAVAQEANRDEASPKVVNAVTLQVTPEQAEKIDLARSIGSLSLVLRNQLDQEAAVTDGATQTSLLGTAPPPREKGGGHAPSNPRHCTPVIAGAKLLRDCR